MATEYRLCWQPCLNEQLLRLADTINGNRVIVYKKPTNSQSSYERQEKLVLAFLFHS